LRGNPGGEVQESVSLASDIGGKGLERDAVEWTAMTDPPATRARFPHFLAVPTRWMDNDAYGHVNNVVYYSYFDTVINRYLVEEGGLDIANGAVIGLCVE
jgi:hypothetical protein